MALEPHPRARCADPHLEAGKLRPLGAIPGAPRLSVGHRKTCCAAVSLGDLDELLVTVVARKLQAATPAEVSPERVGHKRCEAVRETPLDSLMVHPISVAHEDDALRLALEVLAEVTRDDAPQ
ncbi:MAG TPA: hypothetical protein VFQ61_06615 [Polyangiaceae bacterium]|nr:hypothetical protein [Polyangiaceae bacterium]